MSSSERPRVVLVNRCIIEDDGRLLVVRRAADDNRGAGLWEIPGGKLDSGQDLPTALQREVKEETGLSVEPASPLVYANSYVIPDGPYEGLPYVLLVHIGRIVSGTTCAVTLSHEHDEFAWDSHERSLRRQLTPESEKALRLFDPLTLTFGAGR